MKFVYERDRCAEFAAAVLGTEKCWGDWFQCIGAERNGELEAVAVFNDCTEHNVELTVASRGGKWATRGLIRGALAYAFRQLRVKRITAHVRPSNARALSAARRIGFVEEGRNRCWFGDEDAIVFGLLEKDLRV